MERSRSDSRRIERHNDLSSACGRMPRRSGVGARRGHARGVRDVGLAVGRFRVVSGTARAPRPVTVQVAVARSSSVRADTVLRTATRALERLSRLYGAYAWKTYTIVVPS